MEKLLETQRIDSDWTSAVQMHNLANPGTGADFQEILGGPATDPDYGRGRSLSDDILSQTGMRRIDMYTALVTEAGYSSYAAAHAVAGYNRNPAARGYVDERHQRLWNRYLSAYPEHLTQPGGPYADESPTEPAPAIPVQRQGTASGLESDPNTYMPELDHPGSVFRRLGRSVLVAAARASKVAIAFRF